MTTIEDTPILTKHANVPTISKYRQTPYHQDQHGNHRSVYSLFWEEKNFYSETYQTVLPDYLKYITS
jgi:hypothetical protein